MMVAIILTVVPYWFPHVSPTQVEAWGGRVRTVIDDTLLSAWPGYVPSTKNARPVARIRYTPAITRPFKGTFPYGEGQQVLEAIRVVEAHEAGYTGSGVRMGVLDAGFDSTYPGITHLFQNGQVVATYDFQSGDFLVVDTLTWPFFSDQPFYIQDFDVTDSGVVVLAGATEDDLNAATTGGWTLYLLAFTGRAWLPPFRLGTLREGFFSPRVVQAKDTLWITAQKASTTTWWRIDPAETLQTTATPEILFPSLWIQQDTLTLTGLSPSEGGWVKEYRTRDLVFLNRHVVRPLPVQGVRHACFFSDQAWVLIQDTLYFMTATGEDSLWTGVMDLACGDSDVVFVRGGKIVLRDTAFSLSVEGRVVGRSPDAVIVATPTSLLRLHLPSGIEDTLLVGQGDRVRWRGGRWWIRRRGDPDVTPDSGLTQHGSRMLSLIAGYAPNTWVGVAPGVEVVLARTERATSDFEHQIEEDFWVAGLRWAAAWGARVVSSSLGYGRAASGTWYTPSQMDGMTPVSSRVASVAARLWNVLVVTAMGNTSHATLPQQGDTSLVAPADAREILAVGGMDESGQPVLGMGFGPTADGRIKPEVLAPYTATVPGEQGALTISGTSVATALAAGVAALLLEAKPNLSALDLRQRLLDYADPVENFPHPSTITGWGRIQAWPAMQGADVHSLEGLRLEIPYPHPVPRGATRVVFPYQSDAPRLARLWILRVDGRRVGRIEGLTLRVGKGEVVWNPPAQLARGVYWAVLSTPDRQERRLFLVE